MSPSQYFCISSDHTSHLSSYLLAPSKLIFFTFNLSPQAPRECFPIYLRGKLGISYLPQEPSIFRNLSVKSNILGVAELNFSGNQEVESFYEKTLKEFGLSDIENSKGYVLSGGQRRKVEIARCLASRPKLILLDEPFSGIDPLAIVDIKKMLRDLSEKGICILITDHNIKETIEVCDFSIIIADGKILDKGKQEYLVNSKLVKEKYFGKVFD